MSTLEEVLDSPAPAGVRLIAKRMLDDWLASVPALHTDDAEALHDYRVALRKLRSWLRTFDEGGAKVQKQLSGLQEATGVARDSEVMATWLEADGESPAATFAIEQLKQYGAVDVAKIDAKTQRIAERLTPKLSHYALEVPLGTPSSTVTPFSWAYAAALRRAHNEIVDSALAVGALEDAVGLHRVRIRAKRLRYALGPLKGWAEVDEALLVLKQRQDLLGDLHDRHAMGSVLEGFAATRLAPELATGLDALLSRARTEGHALYVQYSQHRHKNDVVLATLLDVICERLGRRMGLHVEIVPGG